MNTAIAKRVSVPQRSQDAVGQRVVQNRVRHRSELTQRKDARVLSDGQRLINFSSNDYLGLSQHPAMVSAMQVAAQNCGVGAGASHLVCGHHAEHSALERALADWLGYPRALLFGSGYLANLAVAQSLLQPGDTCLQDKLNHASLIDAAKLAQAQLVRYPHADAAAARRQAQTHSAGALLLATDGVFSMDGDIGPLPDLAAIAREQDGLLYVDEANAVGTIGPQGRGRAAAAGLGPNDGPLVPGRRGADRELDRPVWLGDGTPSETPAHFRLIRQHTTAPLAFGEICNSIWDCKQLIEEQLIDYIRTTVVHAGGITHLRRIADLASMYQVRTGSHGATDLSPVCMGAALHFDTWVPNFGIQEYMRHAEATDAVFPYDYRFEDGYLKVGDTPGHGVDIDEALAAKYPYEPKQLPVARLQDGSMWNW